MTFRAAFEHRDELLRAALDEFCERGYDAASINRILTASGMSKGRLYHHFDCKAGLYLALCEWMIDERDRWFERHPVAPGERFFDTLGARMAASAAFATTNPDVQRFARALLAERGRPIFERATGRFGFTGDSQLADLVARHHARGDFRSDLSVDFVQRAVLVIVNHAPDLLDLNEPADLQPQTTTCSPSSSAASAARRTDAATHGRGAGRPSLSRLTMLHPTRASRRSGRQRVQRAHVVPPAPAAHRQRRHELPVVPVDGHGHQPAPGGPNVR